jgi:hypothetical protein
LTEIIEKFKPSFVEESHGDQNNISNTQLNNSSLRKHQSDGGETTQGFQTSSRNNSHMQPVMMAHNDVISPIVSAGEVNSELIDKLFRSLKTGGS